MAQGGGGGQRGMRGMRGFADPSGTMLLQRKDVSEELKITDDQKTKLDAVRQKAMEDMRANMPQPGSGTPPDREAMMKMFTKMQENMKTEVAKILTKDQMTRLHEVNIQIAGNMAATFPDVQKDLGISDDQIAKIKDLQAKQQEANMALFQNQDMSREERTAAFTKNSEMLNTEIGKVLTDAQRTKLKAMGGKEFKQDNGGGL